MTTRYDDMIRREERERLYWARLNERDLNYRNEYECHPIPSPSTNDMAAEHIRYLETKIEELQRHISELANVNSQTIWKRDACKTAAKELKEENEKLKEQIKKLNEYDKFDIMDLEL